MLTHRVLRFIDEYVIDFKGEKAAVRAGYSKASARTAAYRLLKNDEVKQAVKKKAEEVARQITLSPERVRIEIGRIAFSDIRKLFDDKGVILPVNKWPDDIASAVASVETIQLKNGEGIEIGCTVKVRLWDKGKQLDLAAKCLGMFDTESDKEGDVDPVKVVFSEENARTE